MGRFASFVADKRIALVGPASTLRGEGKGAYIDDHDIVVRLNHAWPLPADLKSDIGSRIDVIYHNMNFRDEGMSSRKIGRMRRDGVQWMISTHPAGEKRFRPRIEQFRRMNRGRLEFRALPGSLKARMQKLVKHPNAGIMAIEDLLRFPIAGLYVTGFSFYTTGYLPFAHYKPRHARKAVRHHDQNQNKSYFLRLLERDPRLGVDPHIERLLREHRKTAGASKRSYRHGGK